jgi:hypothetical protein
MGCGRGEMSLESLEKPTFSDTFQLFSHGFLRVFRLPFSELRELARIEPQNRWF